GRLAQLVPLASADAEEVIELTTRGLPRGSDLLDLRVRFGLLYAVEGVRDQFKADRVLLSRDLPVGHEPPELGGGCRDWIQLYPDAVDAGSPRGEGVSVEGGRDVVELVPDVLEAGLGLHERGGYEQPVLAAFLEGGQERLEDLDGFLVDGPGLLRDAVELRLHIRDLEDVLRVRLHDRLGRR